jgi:hypothetical protein
VLVPPATEEAMLTVERSHHSHTLPIGGALGYPTQQQRRLLMRPDGAGGLLALPGPVVLVRDLLSQAGHPVASEDFRPFDEIPTPNLPALQTVPTEHPISC